MLGIECPTYVGIVILNYVFIKKDPIMTKNSISIISMESKAAISTNPFQASINKINDDMCKSMFV